MKININSRMCCCNILICINNYLQFLTLCYILNTLFTDMGKGTVEIESSILCHYRDTEGWLYSTAVQGFAAMCGQRNTDGRIIYVRYM